MNQVVKIGRVVSQLIMLLLIGQGAVLAEEGGKQTKPYNIVEQAASELQQKLTGKQEYYAENSAELYDLIDSVLLPNFDVRHAGKLVLGKQHWLAATDDQRQRFIDAFYVFLVKTYANGILDFDQERMKISNDPAFSKDGRKALVGTVLTMPNGDNVEVNYALRYSSGVWKIYDVRIDGVSYVQNYRNQFDAEITARGLQAVIERLETEAKAETET